MNEPGFTRIVEKLISILENLDEQGRPTEKLPDCPKCDDDELRVIHSNLILCYACGWKIEGRPTDPTLPTSTRVPTKPGFYWARWLTAAEGTHEGDELTPATNWEIVEVWENFIGEPCEADADEKFGVSVTGVRETQWLKNFRWDVGPSGKCEPIPEPGMEE